MHYYCLFTNTQIKSGILEQSECFQIIPRPKETSLNCRSRKLFLMLEKTWEQFNPQI